MSYNWHVVLAIATLITFLLFIGGGIWAATVGMYGITAVCGVLAVFWAFLLRNDYYYFFQGGDKTNK